MTRLWPLHARWAEPLALALLGLVLFLRYPIHFILEPPFLMDFEVYRATAERLLHGQGPQLYAPTTNEMMVFKYAPLWARAWVPFAWLPLHAASVLWTAMEIVCLLLTLALSSRLCRRLGLPVPPVLPIVTVLLLTRPLAQEMGNGQANLLWGVLTVASLVAFTQGRVWCGASALAAAILLKLSALIFLPYLALRRDWRALRCVVLALAVGTGLGTLLVAPREPFMLLRSWAQALTTSGTSYTFMIGNQSLLALLGRFLTDDGYGLNVLALPQQTLVWLLVSFAAALLLALGWRAPHRSDASDRFVYDSAILMVMMTVFSPSCWAATYVTLLFPVSLACASLWHPLRQRRIDPASIILSMGVAVASLLTHQKAWRLLGVGPWRGEAYLFLVFMVLPWLALALMGLLWRQGLPQSRRLPPQPA